MKCTSKKLGEEYTVEELIPQKFKEPECHSENVKKSKSNRPIKVYIIK